MGGTADVGSAIVRKNEAIVIAPIGKAGCGTDSGRGGKGVAAVEAGEGEVGWAGVEVDPPDMAPVQSAAESPAISW